MSASTPPTVQPDSVPPVTGPAIRVLVVDDNTDAAESLAMLLTLDGCNVRVCGDAHAALREAADFAPRVVLLDIGLPGLSGYEVAERLRATPGGAALTLIAVTGWGSDRQDKSRAAGFDHHLVKPVDPESLRLLIEGAPAGR